MAIRVMSEEMCSFKIISKVGADGRVSLEFAWDTNQGLGKDCKAAADALLSGKADEMGVWDDPEKISKQPISTPQPVKQTAPKTVQQRV
jgi:hypothetical protein